MMLGRGAPAATANAFARVTNDGMPMLTGARPAFPGTSATGVGVLRGKATGATSPGDVLDPTGTTTIDAETGQAVSLAAVLLGGTGSIMSLGAGRTRGGLAFDPSPVPPSAAGRLLVAGIGGLAAGRRRTAATVA